MRKLLNRISECLDAFVKQRDDVALVLCSPATDAIPILKILEGLEEASSSDLYWTFTTDFTDAKAYANSIVSEFSTKHQVVRLAMEQKGMTPWQPIPSQITSEETLPAERLRKLAAFSRELLPVPNGGNNVWIFYPLDISNHVAFNTLMEDLVRHEFPFPWCHHLRFIIREDQAGRALHEMLAHSDRVQRYEPELNMDAINRSLEEEIADESLPLAERLAPVPIMAGNDFAFGRYPEAVQKYELLLRYYAPLNNYAMAAFALNGMGEVYEKMGDLVRADDSYEAALVPASHGEQPAIPIFLNTVINLANLRVRQMKWDEAEQYFDMAQQLATIARNPTVKISSLENRGVCQQQQGKTEEAVQSWNDGAVIAAQLQDVDSCRALLRRLKQHYVAANETAKIDELQEQLSALGEPQGATA